MPENLYPKLLSAPSISQESFNIQTVRKYYQDITDSTCVGGILLLISKKYKKKLLKCYELLDKIRSSLATFEVLISLSVDDGTVIDAKEFHKLQTLCLQLMTYVRNIDRKMTVQTEESFQKTIMDEIKNF